MQNLHWAGSPAIVGAATLLVGVDDVRTCSPETCQGLLAMAGEAV